MTFQIWYSIYRISKRYNMEFKFFTNELDDISKIIKESFEIEVNQSNFVLQDNQKMDLLMK